MLKRKLHISGPGQTALTMAAAVLLVAAVLLLVVHLPAEAQANDRDVSGVTLTSPNPGELVIIWDEATPTPDDYRVMWAPTCEKFLSYKRDNTERAGNAYPSGAAHTVTGLPEGKEYKVRVRARYDSEKNGAFSPITTISIAAGGDIPDDSSTTATLTAGCSLESAIDEAGDRDWIAVQLTGENTYRIDMLGAHRSPGKESPEDTDRLWDPLISRIIGPDGNAIPRSRNDNSGDSLNARKYLYAQTDGTHYVEVAGDDSWTGKYTVTIDDVTGTHNDDFGEFAGNSGSIRAGNSVNGALEFSGDEDWLTGSLEVGKTYRASMGHRGGDKVLVNPQVSGVYQSDSVEIPGRFDRPVVTFAVSSAGLYHLAAAASDDKGEGWYNITLVDVSDDVADDHYVDPSNAGSLELGATTRGRINYWGDHDWFAITLEPGNYTVRVQAKGVFPFAQPFIDAVRGSAGELLVAGGENRTSLSFNVAQEAKYHVAVAARPMFVIGDTVSYDLRITEEQD